MQQREINLKKKSYKQDNSGTKNQVAETNKIVMM